MYILKIRIPSQIESFTEASTKQRDDFPTGRFFVDLGGDSLFFSHAFESLSEARKAASKIKCGDYVVDVMEKALARELRLYTKSYTMTYFLPAESSIPKIKDLIIEHGCFFDINGKEILPNHETTELIELSDPVERFVKKVK